MDKMREILSMLPEFSICSGGGAANVAKIAGLLGLETAFVGAVGAISTVGDGALGAVQEKLYDQFGRLFDEQLSEAGVRSILKEKSSPTGICLMLQMTDGELKIAASPSAALELDIEDIDEDLMRKARAVVLDGFMLERRPLVQHILTLANNYGTPVALDLSTTGLASDKALEILTYTRVYPLILFMNEDEAKAFYRVLNRTIQPEPEKPGLSNELIDLFTAFTANDIFPVLTVKLGIRGAIVFAGGHAFREETIPVMPLETTGAGDAFCAAFLAAWIRDKSAAECAAWGNKAAREVLDVKGVQPDPKALKQLGKLIK
jgi:sugar/nucleoside kinase (ribokinase family)